MLVYDFRSDRWHTVANMRKTRGGLGLAFSFCDGAIYAVGGDKKNGSIPLDTVEQFNEETCSWRRVSPVQNGRFGHGTASLDRFIFVSGGCYGGALATVERYDPEEDTWAYVAPMSEGRIWHGMAALNGRLYAIGGSDYDSDYKSSGEYYEPHRDQWYADDQLTLREGRNCLGLTALDGCLYAVGGSHGRKSAERFDPREGQWASIPGMSREKGFMTSASIGGRLMAIGNSYGEVSTELFDPIADRWREAATLPGPKTAFAVAWAPWSPDSLINYTDA